MTSCAAAEPASAVVVVRLGEDWTLYSVEWEGTLWLVLTGEGGENEHHAGDHEGVVVGPVGGKQQRTACLGGRRGAR
jgi:hypothetical protein